MTEDSRSVEAAVAALHEKARGGHLTVWATLREDTYETSVGDGYFAYVQNVFWKPSEAAKAIETLAEEPMIRWHIRRYDLVGDSTGTRIRPSPTREEPTTVKVLAAKLVADGLLQP